MYLDISPWLKFWYRGVDICATAASSILVAAVVGTVYFLKVEYDLRIDRVKELRRQLDVVRNKFFEEFGVFAFAQTAETYEEALKRVTFTVKFNEHLLPAQAKFIDHCLED